jgi:hypothetical protein
MHCEPFQYYAEPYWTIICVCLLSLCVSQMNLHNDYPRLHIIHLPFLHVRT